MVPASPPLPTPSRRPFQFVASGSQTSKWITETSVGFRMPCTSQNGGKSSRARPLGGVNEPDEIDLASVMVVLGRARLARPSQFGTAKAGEFHSTTVDTTNIERGNRHRFIGRLLNNARGRISQ